jgi:AraC-like DNA-binding protein
MKGKINGLFRKVAFTYLTFIIIAYAFFSALYFYYDIAPLNYISSILLMIHIAWASIIYFYRETDIVSFVPIYLMFFVFSKYPDLLIFWSLSQPTVFIWYMILPCSALLFLNKKQIKIWSILGLAVIGSAFAVAPFIPQKFIPEVTERQLIVINIATILTAFIMIAVFVYLVNAVIGFKVEEGISNVEVKGSDADNMPSDEIEKYNRLYAEILAFFEGKKPYTACDFTITELAKRLDSNVKYIHQAIVLNGCRNFNSFINQYRINTAKQMLENNVLSNHTMLSVYSESGFRHQSTFNKIFKEIEGITPTEYARKFAVNQEETVSEASRL